VFGCGCVDAPEAVAAATFMNKTYHNADYALSRALSSLGSTVKDGYSSMGNAALDAERVARIKKEQALILKRVGFDTESAADHSSVANRVEAKATEIQLFKAEQTTVFRAKVLNREDKVAK
jgi:hypothetical protein